MRSLLESGAACGCARTAKVCRRLLEGFDHLWTFAAASGVPPHNNAAERALRHGVIWCRTSHGTDGAAGSRYVERMLTTVATCRQRGRERRNEDKKCRDHMSPSSRCVGRAKGHKGRIVCENSNRIGSSAPGINFVSSMMPRAVISSQAR